MKIILEKKPCIFPPTRLQQLEELRKHDIELQRRGREEEDEKYPCKLCGVSLDGITSIKDHLQSKAHHDRRMRVVEMLESQNQD